MANSLNRVQVIGNLGADPEIRQTQSGDPIANFRIAASDSWKDKSSGEWKEKTEWIPVVAFGHSAKYAEQYLRKGMKVFVEGQFTTRKWTDQNGNDRYSTEVTISGFKGQVINLTPKSDADRQDSGSSSRSQSQSGGNGGGGGGYGGGYGAEEEIPFSMEWR